MGKRGPKLACETRGEYASTGATLSARITTATQRRLKDAATANGQSLSRELEARLVRSFDADDLFGPVESHHLLRLIGELAKATRDLTGQSWRRDRATHDLVVEGIKILLDAFAPPGDGSLPETFPDFVGISEAQRASMRKDATRMSRTDFLSTFASQVAANLLSRLDDARDSTDQDRRVFRRIAEAIKPPISKPKRRSK